MRERKYVKFNVNMYSDTKFKIIDTKPERDLIHYIWTRMVILAGKCNQEGELYMSRTIPYNVETLAIEFNRGYVEVKVALDLLIELEMIELNEGNVFKVKNFAKHQNIKVKENVKMEDGNNIKKAVLKSNEIQEKEGFQNQSSGVITKNEPIMKDTEDTLKEQKILEKDNFNKAKEIQLQNIKEDVCMRVNKSISEDICENINKSEGRQDFQENKHLKLLKVNRNKGSKKKKIEDIIVFDSEENKEEPIVNFYDGEIPLGKGEHVIWEFAKLSEG
ncbi:phage replisome organizer N-terminal domain-containing protein [Clostridium sp. C2-6-12]|uniref:phage replisome organizer N-terminal domain-containing protein n=1 Tax=Clostridium sp. C2-6-12 TaxID=2698832 RepID=UPI0013713658|nr:phage replisome organizer N-terminal domain-containing protein [Clostridium sp. C2-6-12]